MFPKDLLGILGLSMSSWALSGQKSERLTATLARLPAFDTVVM